MEHRLDFIDGSLWFSGESLNTDCLTEAARKLLKLELVVPDDVLAMYRGEMKCLTMGVKWGAAHEVGTSNEGTPIFRKVRPVRGSRTAADAEG